VKRLMELFYLLLPSPYTFQTGGLWVTK